VNGIFCCGGKYGYQSSRQMIQELDLESDSDSEQPKVLPSINSSFEYTRGLRVYREAKEIFLSDIISTVIRLEDRYILNEESNSDYIFVKLDNPLKKLSFKAFITSGKVSSPAITFLNKSYMGEEQLVYAFSELTPESWSSYGNISGRINVPADALYLLLLPSPLPSAVETGDQNITVGNLGKILISSYPKYQYYAFLLIFAFCMIFVEISSTDKSVVLKNNICSC
jgi:hypothetical protein